MGDTTNKLIYVEGFLNGGGPSYFSKLLVRKKQTMGREMGNQSFGAPQFHETSMW